MQTQKKSQLKLPHIKRPHKQSANLLSKTISDTNYTPKVRPASSNKVQDLQKKLFTKLQAYETGGSKKKLTKKISKISKEPSLEINGNLDNQQGFQKMQKIMPALYSKLIENKKGNIQSEHLINEFDTPISQKNLPIKKQQSQSLVESNFQQRDSLAEKEQQMMSQQQLDKIFKDYQLLQGLSPSSTKENMVQLNQSIVNCQSNIQQLKKSMVGLIQQIGLEFINQLQMDSEYRSWK